MSSSRPRKRDHRVRISNATTSFSGRQVTTHMSLSPNDIRQRKLASLLNQQDRLDKGLEAPYGADAGLADHAQFNEIMRGDAVMEVSHEGGEFADVAEWITVEYDVQSGPKKSHDRRTRRDRTELRVQGFRRQMKAIVDAYIAWSEATKETKYTTSTAVPDAEIDGNTPQRLRVVDTYTTSTILFDNYVGDEFLASSCVRQGYIPCAPFQPTVVITIRALEFFRLAHLRCPRLAIQQYVKTLCDLHGVAYKGYLCEQFSICFDLYLDILRIVHERVQSALGRNTPDWRLRNACPACTYRLDGEEQLTFSILAAMDGNESLKRVFRREPAPAMQATGETPVLGDSRERTDTRDGKGDYFLSREEVNVWSAGRLAEIMKQKAAEDADARERAREEGLEVEDVLVEEDLNPCEERWKNMMEEITTKAWGIFEETGLFLCGCRHGFVLLLTDMVKSGELSKYPLAIVHRLLKAIGANIGIGYDIGCGFETTVNNSPLGPEARRLKYSSLVGLFHGHAHNRLCQTSKLGTYVKGMGLEDLEGCERFFSKSNNLAGTTRYASAFHRHQTITGYVRHQDRFETYQNLSLFLCNNYHQALAILKTASVVEVAMREQGMDAPGAMEGYLEEERLYLKSLKKEPLNETMEMEYFQKLVQMEASDARVAKMRVGYVHRTPEQIANGTRDMTLSTETARRVTLEENAQIMVAVRELEMRMDTEIRWLPGSEKWLATEEMVKKRTFQRALDSLEGLVVARMFELTKVNMSQTGYKMRKHIGKALQARSKAIRTALDRYNAAAAALSPSDTEEGVAPRYPQLTWDQVVQYAFLSDFDLLRESRQDISKRPWATSAGRITLDQYFKLQRAREEIRRLNVEIPRVVTYIVDEDKLLRSKEEGLRLVEPGLANQIHLHRLERSRFTPLHMKRFRALANDPEFSGSIEPGRSMYAAALHEDGMEVDGGPEEPEVTEEVEDAAGDYDHGEDDEEWEQEHSRAVAALFNMAGDVQEHDLV